MAKTKPKPKNLVRGVVLPSDVIDKVTAEAAAENRSFSNMLVQLLRRSLSNIGTQGEHYAER
jgi:hypothetical protein